MTNDRGSEPFRRIDDPDALDGNVVGGLLAARFGLDLTASEGRCGQCGTSSAIGALRAYLGPEWLLRCPACSAVVIRIATRGDVTTVDVVALVGSAIPQA